MDEFDVGAKSVEEGITVSIPVFIRNPDGTAWEGHIAYKWSALRKKSLSLDFGEAPMPSLEHVYATYDVCSALHISPAQTPNFGQLDSVYKFLYGHTLEDLMEIQAKETYSIPGTYVYEPQEWTTQMVASMDWDSFCLAYYTFLCSKSDFKSEAWKVLSFILNTLKCSPIILSSLLSNAGRQSDSETHSNFWGTVFIGLQSKTRIYLHADTCYTAFHAMTSIRIFSPDEEYQTLENECMEFFDEIARARIDEACQKAYTVSDLVSFNIELLFFYNDYFERFPSQTNETNHYVINAAFTLLHTMGDKIATAGNVLGADSVYESALKYAQTGMDKSLISNKRSVIASSVSLAKAEQENRYRKQEMAQKKHQRKDKAMDSLAMALAILFLVSVVTTVIFGLFTLFGVFNPFSKIVFIISVCIAVPLLITVIIAEIKYGRKQSCCGVNNIPRP